MNLRKMAEALQDNNWADDAACKDADSEIFFAHNGHSTGESDMREAKSYCNGDENADPCPVREECLDYAMVANEKYGVWGGLDENERRSRKREMRYRRKLREEVIKRVAEEQATGHVIRTERRVIIRKGPHV